jgi:hypothetical protein
MVQISVSSVSQKQYKATRKILKNDEGPMPIRRARGRSSWFPSSALCHRRQASEEIGWEHMVRSYSGIQGQNRGETQTYPKHNTKFWRATQTNNGATCASLLPYASWQDKGPLRMRRRSPCLGWDLSRHIPNGCRWKPLCGEYHHRPHRHRPHVQVPVRQALGHAAPHPMTY